MIFVVVVVAVLLPVRGPGVTLVMFAWSRRVPVLALMVTVMWTRQAARALRVARLHCTVAPRAPVRGAVQCPRPAVAERNAAPAGRWPPSLSCHAADGPWSVIVMGVGECRAVAGRWPSQPGSRQGVTATPSEPWRGAVTVAGDRGVILPVTGLIANCDRALSCSLVT